MYTTVELKHVPGKRGKSQKGVGKKKRTKKVKLTNEKKRHENNGT